jgi:transposase
MSDLQSNGTGGRQRRSKRFLSPSEKYEIWLSLVRGEYTIAAAAERSGVDRSTIMKLRMVARQGALDALAVSKPGVRAGSGSDPELAAARAEIARLSEALPGVPRTTAGAQESATSPGSGVDEPL